MVHVVLVFPAVQEVHWQYLLSLPYPLQYRRTEYVCVDSNMESITGSQYHIDGGHFWHVEAHCNGMACPPYDNQKELTCVVCRILVLCSTIIAVINGG